MIYEKNPGAFSVKAKWWRICYSVAFGFNGQVGLAFLNGRQNSPKYIETLENRLMLFAESTGLRNWEYQHDNSPIYTSNATKSDINSKNVTVLEWPPVSSDLNPIENV
ncbi:hypothetical protein AVEN_215941-1 [Araneus ventricosus]|uniref:Tc1-like transposase DDE domain-containing protein n=1 Tax=Araneus ventricosus TaxID=182803 RepID=A0A4Y2HI43_ARAVE|nr:hypothetical protein AVEN_215941-1 [Araneus ventricosus]